MSSHSQELYSDKSSQNSVSHEVYPEDSVSQQGSYVSQSSTSSARAKAAAKKVALKTKMEFFQKKQNLEYQRLEQDFLRKEKMLTLEKELDRERWELERNLQKWSWKEKLKQLR